MGRGGPVGPPRPTTPSKGKAGDAAVRHMEGTVELRLTAAQVAVPVVLGIALATGLLQLGLRWTADPMTAAELRDCAYAAGAGAVGALVLPRLRGPG